MESASTPAIRTKSGGAKSGKPCPRFTRPCSSPQSHSPASTCCAKSLYVGGWVNKQKSWWDSSHGCWANTRVGREWGCRVAVRMLEKVITSHFRPSSYSETANDNYRANGSHGLGSSLGFLRKPTCQGSQTRTRRWDRSHLGSMVEKSSL